MLFHAPTALPPENNLNIFEMKLGGWRALRIVYERRVARSDKLSFRFGKVTFNSGFTGILLHWQPG